MMTCNVVWRKANKLYGYLDNFEPKEFFLNCLLPTVLGIGKEGEMIFYAPVGTVEMEEVLKCSTLNDCMKSWIWYIEKQLKILKEQREKIGENTCQLSCIFDLDQLTFRNATHPSTIDLILRFINLFQENYPEHLKAVYIINAPFFYLMVYNIVKKAMSEEMVKKIHAFGRDDFQDKLVEVIDADLLPAFLGGEKTDPDGNPLCLSFVLQGGPIPEIYHLTDEDRYFSKNSDVKKLIIKKNAKEEIVVDVADNGSLLRWEFCIKNSKEISFGLYHQISNEDVVEILPMEVYHTPDGKEWGCCRCPTAGKYILIFENSQSWMTSREVEYCIKVQKPNLQS